jgi:hypothetical protein
MANPFHQALAEPPEAQVEIWLLAMWIITRNLLESAVISALNERAVRHVGTRPLV